jgi:hypothetical protein
MQERPAGWDLEVDVVAVGSGLGSIGAAIAAHDRGSRALVLEKAPRLGGVCGYGGGEVFVPNNHKMRALGIADSLEAGRRYFEFLSAASPTPRSRRSSSTACTRRSSTSRARGGRALTAVEGVPDHYYPDAPGSHAGGRYLSVDLFEGKTLGEWQGLTYPMTPHVPPGALHREMYAWGGLACVTKWDYELIGQRIANDVRSFGPGLMGWFVKAAMVDRAIPAFVSTPVRALVVEDGRHWRARRAGRADLRGALPARRRARGRRLRHEPRAGAPVRGHARLELRLPAARGRRPPRDGGRDRRAIAAVPPTDLAMFYGHNIPARGRWEAALPLLWSAAVRTRSG